MFKSVVNSLAVIVTGGNRSDSRKDKNPVQVAIDSPDSVKRLRYKSQATDSAPRLIDIQCPNCLKKGFDNCNRCVKGGDFYNAASAARTIESKSGLVMRLHDQLCRYQGKLAVLRHENNKLRRRNEQLRKQLKESRNK